MRFRGSRRADRHVGTSDADRLEGRGGDDVLSGGAGRDTILGGDGDDFLVSDGAFDGNGDPSAEADRVLGDEGDDLITGGWNDTLHGGEGIDTLSLDLRGATAGVRLDLDSVAAAGRSRNGAGTITGFELYGLIRGSAGDDDIRIGTIRAAAISPYRGISGGDGNDRIDAGGEASVAGDSIYGHDLSGDAGDDQVIGGIGADTLRGGEGNDRLVAGDGADTLYGGDGDDVLDARAFGNDFVVGGTGDDTLLLSERRADWTFFVSLGDGNSDGVTEVNLLAEREQPQPNGASGRTVGLLDVELFRFGTRDYSLGDVLHGIVIGTDGADRLVPGTTGLHGTRVTEGDDLIYGSGGSDVIDGGRGADTMFGGNGSYGTNLAADTFYLRDVGDRVMDPGTGDVIRAWISVVDQEPTYRDGRIALIQLEGDADLDVRELSADRIVGNAGNNHLYGTGILEGGAGDDLLESGTLFLPDYVGATASYENAAARVTIDVSIEGAQATGGAGTDTLVRIRNVIGSTFADELSGSALDDMIEGGLGNDRIDGRDGSDTASYAGAVAGVTVNLYRSSAQDTVGAGRDTLVSIENVHGSAFADRLIGARGTNLLSGGAGDDVLDGGLGADRVTGDAGADRFVFDDGVLRTGFGRGGLDVVEDFTAADGDWIDVSAIDADTSRAGDQAFRRVDTFTGRAGQLVVRFLNDGAILVFSGDIDGDGQADFDVAFGSTITPVPDGSFIL